MKSSNYIIIGVGVAAFLLISSASKAAKLKEEAEAARIKAAEAEASAKAIQQTAASNEKKAAAKAAAAKATAKALELAKKVSDTKKEASNLSKNIVEEWKKNKNLDVYFSKNIIVPGVIQDSKGALIPNRKFLKFKINDRYSRYSTGNFSLVSYTSGGNILFRYAGNLYKIASTDLHLV